MTEKELERKFVERVKKKGGKAFKFNSPGHAGVPDRLVLMPEGKIGFVEVKKPGHGRLSKLQNFQIMQLEKLGFNCFILNDPERIDEVISLIGG